MPSAFRDYFNQAIAGSIDASYRQNRDENEAYRGLAARQAALFRDIQERLGKDAKLMNCLEETVSEQPATKRNGSTGRGLPTVWTCFAGRAYFHPIYKNPPGMFPGGSVYLVLPTCRAMTVMSSSRWPFCFCRAV